MGERDRRRRREERTGGRRRRRGSSSDDEDRPKKKRERVAGKSSGWDVGPGGAPIASTAPGGQLMIAGPQPTMPTSVDPNARRLYVGNVVPLLSDEMLANFFKMHAMAGRQKIYQNKIKIAQEMMCDTSTVPQPNEMVNPIVECNVTRSEDPARAGFAFVELNDEELTTECLRLDGKCVPLPDGTMVTLKVSRPKNYVAPASTPPPMQAPSIGVTLPEDARGKLVMSGFPNNMGGDEIKELLLTFGELKNCQMMTEADGASKACCVFEFADESHNDMCINALNGIDMAENHLSVHKVGAGALVLHAGTGPDGQKEEPEQLLLQNLINLGMGLHQALQALGECSSSTLRSTGISNTGAITVKKPTKILALLNLFDEEDLEDPINFDSIKAEIEQEVEKYGRVVSLTIPRDQPHPPVLREKPPKPTQLLAPSTEQRLAITGPMGATAAPPGYALDRNSGALIPLNKVEEETRKIGEENVRRMRDWEQLCTDIDETYEKAREKWEKDVQDPIKNGVGKVFVEYWTSDEAHAAQVALAGRHFDGRTVITSFLPEEWFHEQTEGGGESFDEIMKSLEGGGEIRQIEG
eukprot:TRINITY_DN7829_c5_g1_i1.p1 TRINITY_DN7829_c5_g1~~TRINITY_DN7829_c5_g1_i1.p1  ORF type:complete len:597 (+),score=154.94 TRINITY_DN7829_c5_g1_i1:48-1793(+)